ncbi:EFR1 family ferrodoxin [Methanocella arvoryzae]|uniref:4Fe-4S ferredoxin-domain protein n=1 Tax=Methanocella arvoryzae (strain DSM 22066 / NBRC 105507 / MRE50) TaxID=351160 RepID=Q0W666_METAR|nr:EFR1 family ferrodoxin [Methanocella arvoryzae]CAH04867.1 predicted flavodoxin [uncultured archaeon]CAJ36127.1 4Fe-4S ferredoxin-domain protein [Methanocella arvoryzae MRE50]
MRATIVYFSQTGNTEKVAYELADQLQRAGYEVTPLLFEDVADFPEALQGVDLLGIGFPTFFGYPPQFVLDMIAGLDKADGTGAFVFTTYGGATAGDSLYDAASALAKKGYRFLGGLKIEGADNYPQGIALRINAGRPDGTDMNAVDEFAGKILDALRSGRSLDPEKLASTNEFFVGSRNKPRQEVLRSIFKNVQGKIVFDDKQCLFCETCKKSCPTKSITSGEAFPEFSWTCIGGMHCFQCIRVCPGKALHAEFPGTIEDYQKFWAPISDSPEEKRRTYVAA